MMRKNSSIDLNHMAKTTLLFALENRDLTGYLVLFI